MRIGILGCANIARQFVRDVAGSPLASVVAVASRNLGTATAFARPFGIGSCHGSYEALLADDRMDAIYLPGMFRVRRGTANTVPFEEVACGTGSGFRFAAEAFASVVMARDFAAIERAAQASLDNAATLEALARSARLGHAVDVQV